MKREIRRRKGQPSRQSESSIGTAKAGRGERPCPTSYRPLKSASTDAGSSLPAAPRWRRRRSAGRFWPQATEAHRFTLGEVEVLRPQRRPSDPARRHPGALGAARGVRGADDRDPRRGSGDDHAGRERRADARRRRPGAGRQRLGQQVPADRRQARGESRGRRGRSGRGDPGGLHPCPPRSRLGDAARRRLARLPERRLLRRAERVGLLDQPRPAGADARGPAAVRGRRAARPRGRQGARHAAEGAATPSCPGSA